MRCKYLACAALRSQLTLLWLASACYTEACIVTMCQVAGRINFRALLNDSQVYPSGASILVCLRKRSVLRHIVTGSCSCQAQCFCRKGLDLSAGDRWRCQNRIAVIWQLPTFQSLRKAATYSTLAKTKIKFTRGSDCMPGSILGHRSLQGQDFSCQTSATLMWRVRSNSWIERIKNTIMLIGVTRSSLYSMLIHSFTPDLSAAS